MMPIVPALRSRRPALRPGQPALRSRRLGAGAALLAVTTLTATALVACGSAASPAHHTGAASGATAGTALPIHLASPAVSGQRQLARAFTCDGADRSPPLIWAGVPAGTAELGLVMSDQTSIFGARLQWLVYGIPPTARTLPAGRLPPGAHVARNDLGRRGYSGPCPPHGTTHVYEIVLYALARPLSPAQAASPARVRTAFARYAIARGTLAASYRRAGASTSWRNVPGR